MPNGAPATLFYAYRSEGLVKLIRLCIKTILILTSLAAIGWWSVQNDDDTPRGAPRARNAG